MLGEVELGRIDARLPKITQRRQRDLQLAAHLRYFEMVVGHLWVVGDVDGAASPVDDSIVRMLGGKDTTF